MRVAVTGLGLTSPSGDTPAQCFTSLCLGQSAIGLEPERADIGLKGVVTARCSDTITPPDIPAHQLLGLDRISVLSLWAGTQAVMAAEAASPLPRERMPIVWGCSMGGMSTVDEGYHDVLFRHKKRMRPMTVPMSMPSAPAFHLAHHLRLRGPVSTYTAACASSALAIGQGCQLIAAGRTEAVLVGGVESMLSSVTLRAWQACGALARADPQDPSRSGRPFDLARTGFPIGEGAAALILEHPDAARRRGAQVMGYVCGFGHTTDAAHISRPESPAQIAAMKEALTDARLSPAQIGYINAHGTATVVGDAIEATSIQAVFGPALPRIPVSSTKALHGHALGACGALESIVTLMALNQGMAPPNAHGTAPDPALPPLWLPDQAVDIVSTGSVSVSTSKVRYGITHAFAFGGVNAVLVLESAPHGQ